jgi:hypothetical protein
MIAMLMVVLGLALLSVLAVRFGADSRETERTGWIVERSQPLAAGALAASAQTRSSTPALRRNRPAVQAS